MTQPNWPNQTWLQTETVMSPRTKAGFIPVEADVRARLPFTPGFYSNQVFLRVSTLKPGLLYARTLKAMAVYSIMKPVSVIKPWAS